MAKDFAKKFYKTKAWRGCRQAHIASVFNLCQACLRRGDIVAGHIVHHKIELTPDNISDPSVSLNAEHLEYLCLKCHNAEHDVGNHNPVARDGLQFNMQGELEEV